MQEVQEQLETL